MYLVMFILVIIHSKAILIKTIQTTFSLFNQFCIIVSKHKSILPKSILSESILSESILSNVVFEYGKMMNSGDDESEKKIEKN